MILAHRRAVLPLAVGAPLVTLATAGLAYVIAVRVLAWTGERAGVTVPSEIEPVLTVLLLGVVTDYTMFFMSETRQRLRAGESRVVAARAATARIAPLVLAAGMLVAGGALAAGRQDAVLPRLRPGPRGHGAGRDARVRDARPGADGAARAVAVRPSRRAARRRETPPFEPVRRPAASSRAPGAAVRRPAGARCARAAARPAPRTGRSSGVPRPACWPTRPSPPSWRSPASACCSSPRAPCRSIDFCRVVRPVAAGAAASRAARATPPRRLRARHRRADRDRARAAGHRRGARPSSPRLQRADRAAARRRGGRRAGAGRSAIRGGFVVSRGDGAARFAVVLRDEPTERAARSPTSAALQDRMPGLVRAAGLPAARTRVLRRRDGARARDRGLHPRRPVARRDRHRARDVRPARDHAARPRRARAAARRQRARVRRLVRPHRAAPPACGGSATSSTTCRSWRG